MYVTLLPLILIQYLVVVIECAAAEDLGSTKQRLGGRRTVKKFMRDIMFVVQTSHRLVGRLLGGLKGLSLHLPKFRNSLVDHLSLLLFDYCGAQIIGERVNPSPAF